jgi:hypothetical protein
MRVLGYAALTNPESLAGAHHVFDAMRDLPALVLDGGRAEVVR